MTGELFTAKADILGGDRLGCCMPTADLRIRKANLELLPEKVENTGHV